METDEKPAMPDTLPAFLKTVEALLASIRLDTGPEGGLQSRRTIRCADETRIALSTLKKQVPHAE